MKTIFRIFRTLIYISAFTFLFGWMALAIRQLDLKLGIILPAWTKIPGIIIMIFGGITALSCVWIFVQRGKGTPAIFDPPAEFVSKGLYNFVRNPMYIGGFVALIGFGFFQQSISILILSIILFFLFHLFIIFVEEPQLEKRFGESYVEYKKNVNRWTPIIENKFFEDEEN